MATTYTHTVRDYPLGYLPDLGDEVIVCDEHGCPVRLAFVASAGDIETSNPMGGRGNSMQITVSDASRDWDDLDEALQDQLFSDLHHV